MSRAGYSDDLDPLTLGRWRAQVASVIRGSRGQAFLKELVKALDALPEKKLIQEELIASDGNVCALGSVGLLRGVDMTKLDAEDPEALARTFNIAHQLVREVEYMNDEAGFWEDDPEKRWRRMRDWAEKNILKEVA